MPIQYKYHLIPYFTSSAPFWTVGRTLAFEFSKVLFPQSFQKRQGNKAGKKSDSVFGAEKSDTLNYPVWICWDGAHPGHMKSLVLHTLMAQAGHFAEPPQSHFPAELSESCLQKNHQVISYPDHCLSLIQETMGSRMDSTSAMMVETEMLPTSSRVTRFYLWLSTFQISKGLGNHQSISPNLKPFGKINSKTHQLVAPLISEWGALMNSPSFI